MDSTEKGRPAHSDGYEFKPAEEGLIGEAASWVGYYAWISILLAAVSIGMGITTLPAGAGMLGIGVVYLIVGVFFRGASGSLQNVVRTTGKDVPHLLVALDRLTLAFKVQVVLFLAALIGGIAGVALMGGFNLGG